MKRRRGSVLPCALLVPWLAAAAAADVVTIQPVRDNTLFEDASGSLSNGAGPVLFAGNNGQDLARRALLRFDAAGSLPAGARIDDVVLSLNVSNAPNAILRTFTLHLVLQDWGEGVSSTTSGSGAPATANDATWVNTFWPNELWTSAGGHFVSAASASQSVGDVGVYTWTGPGMKADVQAWVDHPATNLGWLIRSDEVTLNTARRFDSRENSVAANRPTLTISYSGPLGIGDEEAGRGIGLGSPRPNASAGPVSVGFVLPSGGRIRLEVRDLAGRLVTTVLDGSCAPGPHETVWDGRDLGGYRVAAGIYFYRLIVDGRATPAARGVMLR